MVRVKSNLVLSIAFLFCFVAGIFAQPAGQPDRVTGLFYQGLENFKKGNYDAAIADHSEYLKLSAETRQEITIPPGSVLI